MFYAALYALAAKKFGTSRIKGVARAFAYVGGVTLILGAVTARKARADLGQKGLEFGENMESLSALLQDGHTFHLNGQEIHTSVANTLQGVDSVLDKYEANCKASLGNDAPVWDSLPDTNKEPPKNLKVAVMPILRQKNGPKGMVACFIPRDTSASHSERALQAALREFEETGNLTAVGKFRYAYVKEGPTGSTVFTVWTDNDFNIQALMPEPGHDAQGEDPTVMKRPGQTQRLFTGTVEGMPYRVYGYKTTESPKQAIDEYDAQMEKAGWLSVANPIFEGMPHEGNEGRSYINGDKGLAGVVSAIKSPDGETMVGIAEVVGGAKIQGPTQPAKESDGF